jgi:hypothetical protein
MKKRIYTVLLIIMTLFLTGCGNEYKGYWCTYEEKATIVVQFKDNYKEADRKAVEDKVATYDNVDSTNFHTKEDYANLLGQDPNQMDIHEVLIVTFDSMDAIGTYVEQLNKMNGVHKAEQSYAKHNIAIYNIQGFNKYTFTNSDEAEEKDLEKGKVKEKDGVLVFSPEDDTKETKMLYPKGKYLCGDAACKKIYAKSNATCTTE